MHFYHVTLYFLGIYTYSVCSGSPLSKQADAEEYYWRDFNGEIPNDAVPGGVDRDGTTTYIGQVVHSIGKLAMHPGQIHPKYKNISYAFDSEPYSANRFIKILCSSQPEKLRWIKTNAEEFPYLLDQKQFVIGGKIDESPLLIGLASLRDQTIVGKVTIHVELKTIGYVEDSVAIYEDSFKVLTLDV